MELKEFIKTALIEIVEAVHNAKNTSSIGGSICPVIPPIKVKEFNIKHDCQTGYYFQDVEFDIAVSAESKSGANAKAGIKVMGLEANLGGNSVSNNSTISRIKFNVPIGLNWRKISTK